MITQEENKGEDEGEDAGDGEESEEGPEGGGEQEEVLDMPPPWSPKLFINKDKYHE